MTTRRPFASRARRLAVLVSATGLLITSCGADVGVITISAEPTDASQSNQGAPRSGVPPTLPGGLPGTTAPDEPGTAPTTTPTPPTVPTPQTAPGPTLPPIAEPELDAEIPIADVVDVDPDKPPRDYDPFVAVALTDVERWWSEVFPELYAGQTFSPLAGGVYAGYPTRTSDLPGCGGEPTTSYEDLTQFVAFYCEFGDFMIYDDDSTEVLRPLSDEFGPAVMGIVLAHEYGHAIQARIGALDRLLATIITEQQADCFAGAWTGQAYDGTSPLLRLGDADVRAGLIAMLSVRDPVGTDQFVPGGHGSAFDRVGAFQVGFVEGPARCAELLDSPLPLMPNSFRTTLDQALGGNAPYACEDLRDLGASDQVIADCTPAPEFLADDLNDFWATALDEGFAPLTVQPVDDLADVECDDPAQLSVDVATCGASSVVYYDEPDVVGLYHDFGDFTLGYFYGIAWAEVVQERSGSTLTGEARALADDCLTGAWVRDITPDSRGRTPRGQDTNGDGIQDVGITSSPGDLDEAIRMAILEGDDGAGEDVAGTAFEKIAAFRVGVLGGLDACREQLLP